MRSSNPVLGRLVDRSAQHAGYQRVPASPQYGTPGLGYAPSQPDYQAQTPMTVRSRPMTLDDVVVRVVALLAVVGVVGAGAWLLIPRGAVSLVALFGALGVGLVLGLVIAFARVTNPAVILTYAAVEGVLLGLISRVYADMFDGSSIVMQAVVATFAVFFGMAAVYKFRIIRVTPTFAKWLMGALIGVVGLMLVNFLLAAFDVNGGAGLGLRNGSDLAIGFSLLCIGIAALTFLLDFKAIEEGVAAGVDQRYAWYASFGILVGLIWLYLEILRLLGYARD